MNTNVCTCATNVRMVTDTITRPIQDTNPGHEPIQDAQDDAGGSRRRWTEFGGWRSTTGIATVKAPSHWLCPPTPGRRCCAQIGPKTIASATTSASTRPTGWTITAQTVTTGQMPAGASPRLARRQWWTNRQWVRLRGRGGQDTAIPGAVRVAHETRTTTASERATQPRGSRAAAAAAGHVERRQLHHHRRLPHATCGASVR
jgi:hypothetical protein